MDVLGAEFQSCGNTDTYCFSRLPGHLDIECAELMVEQGDDFRYKWDFDPIMLFQELRGAHSLWEETKNGAVRNGKA